MAGDEAVARWIVNKVRDDPHPTIDSIEPIGDGFLEVYREDYPPFIAVSISVRDLVTRDHVIPLFEAIGRQPEFVVNVPSKAIWSGPAIELIHDAPAAFGTLGDLIRASSDEVVSTYRNKEYNFFDRAFRQHTAVQEVTRLYDRVFQLHRKRGLPDATVVLIDAYDMSAEDIRYARDRYGRFDAAVKTTSYGGITTAAREAARSMGAGVFMFGELLGRLNKK